MAKAVFSIKRYTIEQARQNKKGFLKDEWQKVNNYKKPDSGISGMLEAARTELEEFLRKQGYKPPYIREHKEGYSFAPCDPENPGNSIDEAKELICECAILQERLASDRRDDDTLGRIFNLGITLETWRVRPFNDPARTRIKSEQRKPYSITHKDAERIGSEAAKMKKRLQAEGKTDRQAARAVNDKFLPELAELKGLPLVTYRDTFARELRKMIEKHKQ